jgi:hypothetical protein
MATTYTAEMAEQIIEWISAGKPLRVFCREVEGAPKWRTVYDWLQANPDFKEAFGEARKLGFDAIAEEALEIADTPVEGVRTETGGKDGPKEVREDMLGHRKLQIETRLKLLAKWDPKRYGDMVKLGGPDGGPLQSESVSINTDDPVEAARAYQEMIQRGK